MFTTTTPGAGSSSNNVSDPAAAGIAAVGRRTTIDPSQDTLPSDEKQIRRYWKVSLRSLITLGLIGCIAAVIQAYEKKGPLTRAQKYSYNTIIILLTLLLAINMTIAYTHVVLLIREGIVYKPPYVDHHWSFRFEYKFRKITGLRSSLRFMAQELKPSNHNSHPYSVIVSSVFVGVWLVFNLAVAVAIALIGLTYSLEEGGIGKSSGYVSILDTNHFYVDPTSKTPPRNILTERFVAKVYADVSVGYEITTPDKPVANDRYQIEKLDDGWRYTFRERNHEGTIILRSDRYIETHASCRALKITDFNAETFTLKYMENGKETTIDNIIVIPERTTYMSMFDKNTGNIVGCGNDEDPRCGWVGVVQMDDWEDFSNAFIYLCWSRVSEVKGATLEDHKIPDVVALTAATSLAQSGLFDSHGLTFAYYMNEVRWGEIANGDPKRMEEIISRGAAGCIAAMDQLNPRTYVPGQEPWQGVELKVRWPRLIAVLVVIGCLQLIAAISSILWHRKNLKSTRAGVAAVGSALSAPGGAGLGNTLHPINHHPPANSSPHGNVYSPPPVYSNANSGSPQPFANAGFGLSPDPNSSSTYFPPTSPTAGSAAGSLTPGGFPPAGPATPSSGYFHLGPQMHSTASPHQKQW